MSDDRAATVSDYVSRGQIEDLWSIGFTIVARARHADPFHVPPAMVPQGRRYQWWHLVHDRVHFERPKGAEPSGWAPVPASRHDGYFMPFGHHGDIEVGGLGLFEKSAYEVEQELAANTAAAHKQVEDWVEKTGAGLSGSVTVGGVKTPVGDQAKAAALFVDSDTKTIDTTVQMPADMLPYMGAVFHERDRLYAGLQEAWETTGNYLPWQSEVMGKWRRGSQIDQARGRVGAAEADPRILRGPTLNALLLPIAVENVRANIQSRPMTEKLKAAIADRKEKTDE